MEQEQMKRAREEEEEGEAENHNNTSKKRSLMNEKKNKEVVVVEEEEEEEKGYNSFNALGVFDFPWLKDGVMSKSEEGNFNFNFLDCEDSFFFLSSSSSSLQGQGQETCFKGVVDFAKESMADHVPEERLVEDLWQPFEISNNGLELEEAEDDDVDCGIWRSLLNQPL